MSTLKETGINREGVNSKPSEVLGGNKLLSQTVNSVNQAFKESMPIEFSSQANLSVGQINFDESRGKIEEMEARERASYPRHVYDGLIETGVSPQLVNSLFSHIDIAQDIPIYWNHRYGEKSTVYIPKDIKNNLSKDLQTKIRTSMILGIELIEQMVMRLPIPATLNNELWREIATNNLDTFLERVAEEQKLDNAYFADLNHNRLALVKERLHALLREQTTEFIANGAEVNIVFPGQDIGTSDFSLGSLLNQGIIESIAKPIQSKFVKLMIGKENQIKEIVSQTEKNSMQIIQALGIDIPNLLNEFRSYNIPNRYSNNRNTHIQGVKTKLAGYNDRQLVGMVFAYLFKDSKGIINPNLYPN